MNANKLWIPCWKHVALVVLITLGVIWGTLKWVEKAYAHFYFKSNECSDQYESHHYIAFSLLSMALPLEDQPMFIRLIEKNWPCNRGNRSLLDNERA